jgi:phosphate starvation-inducible PhoH-like protein
MKYLWRDYLLVEFGKFPPKSNTYAGNSKLVDLQNLRKFHLNTLDSMVLSVLLTTLRSIMSRNRAVKQQKSRMTNQENTIKFEQAKPQKQRPIDIVPRTRNQERLVLALQNDNEHIVVTAGPAGTGKTYLAMLAAVKAFRQGDVDRIVLTRPAVGVEDEKHGFLPGDLNQKMDPWVRPLTDILREYYRPADITAMITEQVIEIAPLAFMRGRTLKNAYIVADEMQNSSMAQVKMLLTRIGEGSKIVITGDVEQTDHKKGSNGLVDLCERLQKGGVKGIAVCQLDERDVQRHHIIGKILQLYKD